MQKGGFLGFGQGAYFSEFRRGKGAAGEAQSYEGLMKDPNPGGF